MTINSEIFTLDGSIPIPLYYQLKSLILNAIKTGNLSQGERIPTEEEFQEILEVSRGTIRHAISELVQEGWLERKKSKGTFVTRPSQTSNVFRSFEPFYRSVQLYGKTPRTEVIKLEIIPITDTLAKSMNLTMEDKVISMFRRRFIDEDPVVTMQNYLPYPLCEFVFDYDFTTKSLYETLMQHPASRISQTRTIVSSEKATAKDVQLLNVEIHFPMLIFNTISTTSDDKVIDFAYAHYRGDMNKFEVVSSPDDYIRANNNH